MICETCQDVLGSLLHDYSQGYRKPKPEFLFEHPHHPTLQSLQRSVDAGCWLCSALWIPLAPEKRTAICEAYGSGEYNLAKGTPAFTKISMLYEPLGDFDFSMFLNCDSPDPARNFRHGKVFKVREGKLGHSHSLFQEPYLTRT